MSHTNLVGSGNERRLVLQEQFDDFGMILLGGQVDHLLAQFVGRFQIGAQFDQQAAHLQLAGAGRQMQRRLLAQRQRVDGGVVGGDQRPHQIRVAFEGGQVQRSQSHPRLAVDERLVGQQGVADDIVTAFGGHVQSRHSVQVENVDAGLCEP